MNVFGLTASGNDLYVGGNFTMAGGKAAEHLAKARVGSKARSLVANEFGTTVEFSGVTGYEYDLLRATNLTAPIVWAPVNTNRLIPAADGSFTFTDTNPPPGKAFYRAAEH